MVEEVGLRTARVGVNGRPFELREYTLEQTGKFIDEINASLMTEQTAWNGVGDLADLYDKIANSLEPTLTRILSHPLDGGGPVDGQFVASLALSQRKRLLELQGELNTLQDEAFAGKCLAVLQAVSAWRTAKTSITGAGKPPTKSEPSTAVSQSPSSQPGALARLWATLRGLLGMSGGKAKIG